MTNVFNKHDKRKSRGFTLVEMAVVVTIISLAAIGGLTILSRNITSDKITETEERQAVIQAAIKKFASTFNYIPCPSRLTDTIEATNFGTVDYTSGCSSASTTVATGDGNVYIGAIPIQDLGLEPKYMFDGWGRRFTYVVASEFIVSGSIASGAGFLAIGSHSNPLNCNWAGVPACVETIIAPSVSEIRFYHAGTTDAVLSAPSHPYYVDNGITDGHPAYLVISHGINGHGAWVFDASAQLDAGTNAGSAEDENIDPVSATNRVFHLDTIHTATDTAAARAAYFDDIILYESVWSLRNPPALPFTP